MTEKKKIPEIRLSGFKEDWITTKLGSITERVIRKNTNMDSTLPLTISAQYGLVDQRTFFNSQVASQNISNYYLLMNGEFAYNKSTSQDYPVGAVKRLDRYDMGVLSTLYILFKPRTEVSSDYLVSYFDSDCWHREIILRAAEGARNHGLLNISPDDFFDIDVNLPQKLDEQQNIGDFLKYIDSLILQRRSKLKKAQDLKASMLEKMFPKDGPNMPEVRFKGFTAAWERKSASELFISYADKGHPELPVLSATQEAGMVVRDKIGKSVFHDAANEIGYKRVMPGQFVIHLRSFQGGFAHSAIEGITSPAYTVFGFKEPEKHDDYYWKYVFTSKQFIKRLETVTYGIRDGRSISYEEFLTLDFLFPQKEEQTKICTYLRELDRIIFLRQQELAKLQSIKKALLEKMFV